MEKEGNWAKYRYHVISVKYIRCKEDGVKYQDDHDSSNH